MASFAWRITNLIYTIVTLVAIIFFVVMFHIRKFQFERGFKLIFASLILGFICKTTFCSLDLTLNWTKNNKQETELKFVAWSLSEICYITAMITFDMLIAKVTALLYALARKKLSDAIGFIRKTSAWIFWVGLVIIIYFYLNLIVSIIIYYDRGDGSKDRLWMQNWACSY